MNYLSPYEQPPGQQGIVPTVVQGAKRALSVVPPAKWILRVCEHLYSQLHSTLAAYQYRRETRRDFNRLMQGWAASDNNARAAHGFCQRAVHLLPHDRQDEFMMAIVAFARMDTAAAIRYFAEQERNYVRTYLATIEVVIQ